MERVSGYAINDMDELLRELHKTFLNAPNHPQQAVRQKYQQDEWGPLYEIFTLGIYIGGFLRIYNTNFGAGFQEQQ